MKTVTHGQPNLLASLQMGRAIAAMAVVVCHAEQFTRQFAMVPSWAYSLLSKGYLGVDFFFALSGFIIYYSNCHSAGGKGWASRYWRSRLTRIYVPYLPIGLALGVTYALQPQLAGEYGWGWFSTLTLLPSGGSPALAVAWTLQHEILFYAVMLLLMAKRMVLVGCLIWLCAIIVNHFVGRPMIGLSLIDIEFLAGVAAAWLYLKYPKSPATPVAALGLLLCVGALVWGVPTARLLFGIGMAALILAAARGEAMGNWRVPGLVLLSGEASYAIYLIHVPLLRLAARWFGEGAHWALLLPGLVLLAAIGGLSYHLFFERPGLTIVRNLLRTRTAVVT